MPLEQRNVMPIGDYSHLNISMKHEVCKYPKYLMGNIAVAIDTETTGTDPFVDSIWEIAVIPLDTNWLPQKDVPPFYMLMRPRTKIEAVDWRSDSKTGNRERMLKAFSEGFDPIVAADLFLDWKNKIDLIPTTKLESLGHNVDFDIGFLKSWLTPDLYDNIFSHKSRDTMKTEMFIDDMGAMRGEKNFTRYYTLENVASRYGIVNRGAHNALNDAITCAEIYSCQTRVQLG